MPNPPSGALFRDPRGALLPFRDPRGALLPFKDPRGALFSPCIPRGALLPPHELNEALLGISFSSNSSNSSIFVLLPPHELNGALFSTVSYNYKIDISMLPCYQK